MLKKYMKVILKTTNLLKDFYIQIQNHMKKIHRSEDINFYAKQTRTALANCGHINAECLDEAIAVRGYEALAKVLEENNPEGGC